MFEGHFPGYPILPGVLMIEMMAQTGGWLVLALGGFERMAFLAQVEKAKLRSFVTPGESLQTEVRLVHEGSGYAVVAGHIRGRGQEGGGRGNHLSRAAVPQRGGTTRTARDGSPRADAGEADRRRPGNADAGRDVLITGIGLVSSLGEGLDAHWAALNRLDGFVPVVDAQRFAPFPVHPMVPLAFDSRSPSAATNARWSHGSGSAPMPPGWRWTRPG